MSLVKNSLLDLGLPENQYFEESFEISAIEAEVDDSPQEFDLKFSHSNIEIKVASNQTVLEAAEKVGIYLDYSCSSGICGSCTSYLLEGEIHAPEAKAIDDSDRENGEFLPCCSFARSNLVVDL
jgi:ferredoxin